ncbi:hypothetical protein HYH02_000943 [Chlamydomonas schloesseri]|uniref:Uncharacterized protein n=1 Tax=Chlamydomonas schloesseri TaxID=2026947 RepID=A0A836BDE3_9CHLO|nr:hypothetical protein HYH02_000943 [Chlamydomonas schloesseri]|eukprot:KAG2455123.1 hypothetical protein HYH02_000943 [Chlamydomonas schloesseri]
MAPVTGPPAASEAALLAPGSAGASGVTKSAVRPDLLAWGVNQLWGLEQSLENWLGAASTARAGCSRAARVAAAGSSSSRALSRWWAGRPTAFPTCAGRTALVTGGSSGIGLEVARKLAQNCCRVLLVSRDLARGEAAAAHIRESLGDTVNAGTVEVLQCNLLSLSEVASLVAEVKRRLKAGGGGGGGGLNMLMCNAAVFQPGGLVRSPQGIEQTLAVDLYAHVALTLGLLEDLKRGAAARGGARVVLQARAGHEGRESSQAEQFGTLELNNLMGEHFTDSGMRPYAAAKLWLLMWGDELQRRLRAEGGDGAKIDVFGVHPGLVDSPLMDKADTARHWNAAFIVLQNCLLGMPTWRGSLPALYALTEPALARTGFRYFGPSWLNTHMLGERCPGNRLWRVGGPELRSRLFDGLVGVLTGVGHKPKHVPPPVLPGAGTGASSGYAGGGKRKKLYGEEEAAEVAAAAVAPKAQTTAAVAAH